MMTLVVSSRGGFSDSHSDDADGSNYCFTGKKLWLAWDTQDGMLRGLEDLDQQRIEGQCAFDLETWLAMPSATWFTVEPGQTLFMPGHLTHKVITLEPYLGVGSFYLAFPNLMRTLSRWLAYTPNWAKSHSKTFRQSLYPEVFDSALGEFRRISRCSGSFKQRWGLDFLSRSFRHWSRHSNAEQLELTLELDSAREFLGVVERAMPGSVPQRLRAA